MEKRTSKWLLLLLVLLVFAASSHGASVSRRLKMFEYNKELSQDLHDVEHVSKFVVSSERRMDLTTMDYPGTGASTSHIPRHP